MIQVGKPNGKLLWWSAEEDAILIANAGTETADSIRQRLGNKRSRHAIYDRIRILKKAGRISVPELTKGDSGSRWSKQEIAILTKYAAIETPQQLFRRLKTRTPRAIYCRMNRMGINRPHESEHDLSPGQGNQIEELIRLGITQPVDRKTRWGIQRITEVPGGRIIQHTLK